MLNLFEELSGVKQGREYQFVRKNLYNEKKILSSWVENFIDRDGKIIREFQEKFYNSFWEFYLFSVLSELQFKVDFSKKTPDFVITAPANILIEAVVAKIKTGGKQFEERTIEDSISMLIPPHLQLDFYQVLDEAIVRHSNSFLMKWQKYGTTYSKQPFVTGHEPFIIAISSYDQINYGREYIYSMMALLFGLYYDPAIDDYIPKTAITKPESNAQIPIGLFNDSKYEDVSAVLFSCTTTLGKLTSLAKSDSTLGHYNHVVNIRQISDEPSFMLQHVSPDDPEELSDGLFLLHNPYAKNSCDRSIFKNSNITQIYLDDEQFRFEGNTPPIFSRFNSFMKMPDHYFHRIINTFNRR